MKYIVFQTKENKEKKLGILSADGSFALEINQLPLSKEYLDMNDYIQNRTEADEALLREACHAHVFSEEKKGYYSVADIKLCAPFERTIHDILCVGVNYRSHLEETREHFEGCEALQPAKPIYFSKRVVKTIGPEEEIESHANLDKNLDYEAELAVIIGKKGRDIPKEDTEKYIFGYTIMNDISARGLQQAHVQWFRGKSLDTFTALGPVIVDKEEISYPLELYVKCRVNGEERQSSNTKLFLADVPTLLADLSAGMTLEPGDILSTGTPSGVGMGYTPPRYLKAGDVVECQVEKIGILKNTVK